MTIKRLDEALPFTTRTELGPWLDRMLDEVEARLQNVEVAQATVDQTMALIRDIALARINETITPLVIEVTDNIRNIANMFTATITEPHTVILGDQTFIVDDGERATFAPLDYVIIRCISDDTAAMIGAVDSYNPVTGELAVNVQIITGTGSHTDWKVAVSAPPDLVHAARTDDPHHSAAQAEAVIRDGIATAYDTLFKLKGYVDTADLTKAPLASPALTGLPTAPTPPLNDSSTRLATTAAVVAQINKVIGAAPGALDTLQELAAALGSDPNYATTVTNALATKAPITGPMRGQCRLVYNAAASIRLACFNGNQIWVNGAWLTIPQAGVIAANTGIMLNGVAGQSLAASIPYLVSCYNNAGAPALAYWTLATGHGVHTDGTEIITGQAGHTLVGMVRTVGAAAFSDTDQYRFVSSWFNKRRRRAFMTMPQASYSVGANPYYEPDATFRPYFLTLSDADTIHVDVWSEMQQAAKAFSSYLAFAVDDATARYPLYYANPEISYTVPQKVGGSFIVAAEGEHHVKFLTGIASGASTLTITGSGFTNISVEYDG